MIRLIVFLALALTLGYCAATVPLGKRTFFGHVGAIWAADEVQDLKHGVEEKAGPTVLRMKRGVDRGIEAATEPLPDAGVDAAVTPPAERP